MEEKLLDVVHDVNGAQGRICTADTRIFSPLLYSLSYLGPLPGCGGRPPVICGPSGAPAFNRLAPRGKAAAYRGAVLPSPAHRAGRNGAAKTAGRSAHMARRPAHFQPLRRFAMPPLAAAQPMFFSANSQLMSLSITALT